MVYVLNKDGIPIMPTKNHAKVRILLKQGKAKVLKRTPFTIQLLYNSTNHTQSITLGVDAGSKIVGLSATTEKKELYASNVELRNDIVDYISERRQYRRSRRSRKTRYRKARFNNRVSTKKNGWLAPSVKQKIESHLNVIDKVYQILPITRLIVETASFDIQKIKNPDISGTEYQHGEQMDFWNTREYILFRDNHTCQCCNGKKKDKVLNVHHIESRKVGGNAPNNLITLCETCHKRYHNGTIHLPKKIKRGMSFRDAAFMGIMRWSLYEALKKKYPNVNHTYGYLTKNVRIEHHLPKEHYIDARCISGNSTVEPMGYYYCQKKVRCHNRQIHKAKILKGNRRKLNQAPYLVNGFRLFDKIKYQGKECFIFGRRTTGYFSLRLLDNTKIHNSAKSTDLILLEKRKSYLIERRNGLLIS